MILRCRERGVSRQQPAYVVLRVQRGDVGRAGRQDEDRDIIEESTDPADDLLRASEPFSRDRRLKALYHLLPEWRRDVCRLRDRQRNLWSQPLTVRVGMPTR